MKKGAFGNWKIISLDEALVSLEGNLLPKPSIQDLSCLLHKCSNPRNRDGALRMHSYLKKNGLESDKSLGNYMVSLLADFGIMDEAQKVFDGLSHRSEWSWNSLMRGYIKSGNPELALELYEQMQLDSVHPSAHVFVGLLKACTKLKDLQLGLQIHIEVARRGFFASNIFVGSAVVALYSKCGSLAIAKEVFYCLPVQHVVAWTSLVTGYVEHGDCEEALMCLQQMKLEGVFPNTVTYICSLKACSSMRDIVKGRKIHVEIISQGLSINDVVVGNALIDMYAKCGYIGFAKTVFDMLPAQDAISWTSLISGHAENGDTQEALRYFEKMQSDGVIPDAHTFVCMLKLCGTIGATMKGQEIHDKIERQGLLRRNLILGSVLVDMYVKFGLLIKAQEVFDGLPVQNVAAWNALIAGYTEHGQDEEALQCFERMQFQGVPAEAVTYICTLKACGNIQAIERGQEIHAEVERNGLLETELIVGNALINMYAKCCFLTAAHEVFEALPIRDVVSWNVLISGYMEHEFNEGAIRCYEHMQIEGMSPDSVSFLCSLRACCSRIGVGKGQEIHAEIERRGLVGTDIAVGNTLVSMYATFGSLSEAQHLFHMLPVKNTISWNALISGYIECGHNEKALEYFQKMRVENAEPDIVTFISCLNACSSIQNLSKGEEIYAEIEKQGWLEKDIVIGNTLVNMYAKCGQLDKALNIFDELQVRDVVSWNALIAGYAEHEYAEEALSCLEQMQIEGVFLSPATLVCGLNACGKIGALDKAGEIHTEIERQGLLERDLILGNSLVSLYSKCGWLDLAQKVFDKLPLQNVVSRTILMVGYAHIGEWEKVVSIFDTMLEEGIKPDSITFIVILTACSRVGLSHESERFFESMSKEYGVPPTLQHRACMVDLLGRIGRVDRAVEMIREMPGLPNVVIWQTILAACQKCGNFKRGKEAFDEAVGLDERDAIAYVFMSHICSGVELQEFQS